MARKFLKRHIPDADWIKKQDSLKPLGKLLHDPNIWHLNRQSATTACFIGTFVAFIPVPTQMLLAAFMAIAFRANLAISVALVWITNPLTVAPIYYVSYKVGVALLGVPEGDFAFELSWEWLSDELAKNWQPFLLGCFVSGLFFALLSSTALRWAWRHHTIKRWHERRLARLKKEEKN